MAHKNINAINSDGSVFVGEGNEIVSEVETIKYPFISQNGLFRLIDIPANLVLVTPKDISSDGTRFIGSAYNYNASVYEAILWDEASGLHTVYDELVSRGLEFPPGVTEISYGYFISSDGRTLIGRGTNTGPFWRAVLLD